MVSVPRARTMLTQRCKYQLAKALHRFSWANGLFGQMMLDLRDRKPHLLALSYQ